MIPTLKFYSRSADLTSKSLLKTPRCGLPVEVWGFNSTKLWPSGGSVGLQPCGAAAFRWKRGASAPRIRAHQSRGFSPGPSAAKWLFQQAPKASLLCTLLLAASSLPTAASAQSAPPPPTQPQRVHPNLSGFDLSSSGKSANQTSGASRGTESPLLFAPQSGKSFTTHPEFHWRVNDAGQKVIFRLSSLDGTPLFEAETTDDNLKYPADAPALTPGSSYLWTIAPDNEMQGGPSPPAAILIVGAPERDKIAAELKAASGDAAAAQVCVDHRVWYDAIERYSTLLAQRPDDQKARTMRAELYDQLPATKSLAEADWRMVH
jgi:hypothetical protein